MHLTQAGLLLVTLLVITLLAMGVAGAAVTLARWEGRTVPAAISRGGIAFAGTMTLGASLVSLFLMLK
ncbi:hypothetical protein [Streptomyces narbonensis]|uniref:hypothetical protein n=1 Tax=Streptomyces narbonensis TaxID=67333 RepID=UPI00167619E5|nr:hypothetical protein [Streptomyces narbonensis]GGW02068.1 hypothetical protein GCM10010230_34270 [Streptomyces narbonensis]